MIADNDDAKPGRSRKSPVQPTGTSVWPSNYRFVQYYRSSEFSHGLLDFCKFFLLLRWLCSFTGDL